MEHMLATTDVATALVATPAQHVLEVGLCVGDAACMALWQALGPRAVATAQVALEGVGCPILQHVQAASHPPVTAAAAASTSSSGATAPVSQAAALAALQRIKEDHSSDGAVHANGQAVAEAIRSAAAAAAPAASGDVDGLPLACAISKKLGQALVGCPLLHALLPGPAEAGAEAGAGAASGGMCSAEEVAALDVRERLAWVQEFRWAAGAGAGQGQCAHVAGRQGSTLSDVGMPSLRSACTGHLNPHRMLHHGTAYGPCGPPYMNMLAYRPRLLDIHRCGLVMALNSSSTGLPPRTYACMYVYGCMQQSKPCDVLAAPGAGPGAAACGACAKGRVTVRGTGRSWQGAQRRISGMDCVIAGACRGFAFAGGPCAHALFLD
jgi:hypothetical protein